MGLDPGEKIHYRPLSGSARYAATVVSSSNSCVILRVTGEAPSCMANGDRITVSCADGDYCAELRGREEDRLLLKGLWSERRSNFRVDDVSQVIIKRTDKDHSCRRSRVLHAYDAGTVGPDDLPGDMVHPQLWKMLASMNDKLEQILGKLSLEKEGFDRAGEKPVNISASGIRSVTGETVVAGDEVEVKLLLPTCPPTGIQVYGRVVRTKVLGAGECEVAIHFTDMDDEVRERIIQYTISRQRELMREKKQQSGNDVP